MNLKLLFRINVVTYNQQKFIIMRRYFYEANPLVKRWLQSQFSLQKREDEVFRSAILSALHYAPKSDLSQLHDQILNLNMEEQAQYSLNCHLDQLFTHFSTLYRVSRGKSMVRIGLPTLDHQTKQLVDPDKFPVWDTSKPKDKMVWSRWKEVRGELKYDLGFEVGISDSLVQHPDGGRGVFISFSSKKEKIQVGEFLGFVPGHIYEHYDSYKKNRLNQLSKYERIPQHLHFPSGKVLELSNVSLQVPPRYDKQQIDPTFQNPYAIGHFINHPPVGQYANVCFTEIQLPQQFFPSHYYGYLPYESFLPMSIRKKHQKVPAFGIFATRPINNNDELYVDYLENHIYPIENLPDWLLAVPEEHNFFKKQQYEHPQSLYWEYLESKALQKNKALFEEYSKRVTGRMSTVVYQDSKMKIRGVKMDEDR